MIHSQERMKLVYSMSLQSAMNRKKRGMLCKDSAKPTEKHGDLSAIRRWFSFFVPYSWFLYAFFAAITYDLKINILAKWPINKCNLLIFNQ